MHGAHILPKPAHFGCMAAICCRELVLFPSEAPSGTHEAKKLPRIAARKRIGAKSCHGRPPENAPRRNIATTCPRERMAPICCHGRALRGYAAEICCRCLSGRHWRAAAMKEPGVPEGTIDPSAASGASALRPSIGTRAAVFSGSGGTAQPARCRVRLSALIAGAWGPLGRSWVATTARTFIAGARAPFSGLMRGVASSLRCIGGQPWARFAFCGAVPYHVLKQNAL